MIGRMILKHSVKHVAGMAATATPCRISRVRSEACVLMYHRVADTGVFDLTLDDWNITPTRLENQLRWLSKNADCVPLADVPKKCGAAVREKPMVALTFDDGFACFRQEVLPLLQRFGIPATLFVVTRFVGSKEPFPFDRWGQKNHSRTPANAWRPITWPEIEECLDSNLVSIGSHSHRHLNALEASDEQLMEEASLSREQLLSRLGPDQATLYAYPYGSSRLGQVRNAYIQAVRDAGYSLAVTTDLGLAQPFTAQFEIPRVEVHALDSPRILRAKIFGNLWPQGFCDRLRQARRRANL